MDNLEFKLSRRVTDIPRADWDSVLPADAIENYDYFKTLDESNITQFSCYYATVYKNNAVAAIAPFYTMVFSLTGVLQGPFKKILAAIQKKFPGFLKIKALFFGSAFAEEGLIGLSKKYDTERVLDFLLKKIYRFCGEEKIFLVAFYNLTSCKDEIASLLQQQRFTCMRNFPFTNVAIRDSSLEEYIQGLGPSTRKDIRRKLRKAYSLAKIEIETSDSLNGMLDEAYQLYLNNFDASDVSFEKVTPEYFSSVSKNLPGETKFFIWRVNGRVAAFNMCLVKGDVCIDKYLGLDYELAHKYNLYFLTWCHNIEWCIKNGVRHYRAGQCNYEPKLRMKAELMPAYIYMRAVNPVVNFFAPPIIKLTEPVRYDPVLRKLNRHAKK